MQRTRPRTRSGLILALMAAALSLPFAVAQVPTVEVPVSAVQVDPPDSQRTQNELRRLLQRYPPSLRNVLALDPSLLTNSAYLAPYPALAQFLQAHPEIMRNPTYYVGTYDRYPPNPTSDTTRMWSEAFQMVAIFVGFGMAISLLVWLIRTALDHRRWARLSKVQTEVHTKLLDRFTANDDLLSYIQSPAGSRFLQSAPIKLDAGPSHVGAPLGRILFLVQAGIVLAAGGFGLLLVTLRVSDEAAEPLRALGILGAALGIGFVISAIISYVLSNRLGLIERAAPSPPPSPEPEI